MEQILNLICCCWFTSICIAHTHTSLLGLYSCFPSLHWKTNLCWSTSQPMSCTSYLFAVALKWRLHMDASLNACCLNSLLVSFLCLLCSRRCREGLWRQDWRQGMKSRMHKRRGEGDELMESRWVGLGGVWEVRERLSWPPPHSSIFAWVNLCGFVCVRHAIRTPTIDTFL